LNDGIEFIASDAVSAVVDAMSVAASAAFAVISLENIFAILLFLTNAAAKSELSPRNPSNPLPFIAFDKIFSNALLKLIALSFPNKN